MDLDSIELHLQRMRVAAETKQYATAESEYKLALTRAEELVEEEAPFLLMLLCMASLYKSQFKWAEAEYYSERARQIIDDERRKKWTYGPTHAWWCRPRQRHLASL